MWLSLSVRLPDAKRPGSAEAFDLSSLPYAKPSRPYPTRIVFVTGDGASSICPLPGMLIR